MEQNAQDNNQNDEYMMEPPTSGSFLERYRLARSPSAPTSPVVAPAAAPASPQSPSPPSPRTAAPKPGAAQVWGSVFHPLGRSPKSAARYDSPSHNHGEGGSVSELHDEGRATAISIDRVRED
jgi:hypothetical protein